MLCDFLITFSLAGCPAECGQPANEKFSRVSVGFPVGKFSRVSKPVFTEFCKTEKPGNPGFLKTKTGFWLLINPVFRFWILTYSF